MSDPELLGCGFVFEISVQMIFRAFFPNRPSHLLSHAHHISRSCRVLLQSSKKNNSYTLQLFSDFPPHECCITCWNVSIPHFQSLHFFSPGVYSSHTSSGTRFLFESVLRFFWSPLCQSTSGGFVSFACFAAEWLNEHANVKCTLSALMLRCAWTARVPGAGVCSVTFECSLFEISLNLVCIFSKASGRTDADLVLTFACIAS